MVHHVVAAGFPDAPDDALSALLAKDLLERPPTEPAKPGLTCVVASGPYPTASALAEVLRTAREKQAHAVVLAGPFVEEQEAGDVDAKADQRSKIRVEIRPTTLSLLLSNILFYSVLFYSILFCSVLFCSILFYSLGSMSPLQAVSNYPTYVMARLS